MVLMRAPLVLYDYEYHKNRRERFNSITDAIFCEVLVCNTVKVESGESGLFYFFKHFTRSKVGLFNFITEIKFKVDITLFRLPLLNNLHSTITLYES